MWWIAIHRREIILSDIFVSGTAEGFLSCCYAFLKDLMPDPYGVTGLHADGVTTLPGWNTLSCT